MHQATYQELPEQIRCIDTEYLRPGLAACYLIESAGELAFIDTGTQHTVPLLIGLLDSLGLDPAQVRYVIPTHVHLDHAGGAGQLMAACPQAQLIIHRLGAPHMIDPTKLTAGVKAVYGEAKFHELYGELLPVDAERVLEVGNELSLPLGRRNLLCIDSPGHARHHICIYDDQSRGIFSGDTFGLSYRAFDSAQGPFILPTTTPVQFEPDAWHSTLDKLSALEPQTYYLTHFGAIRANQKLADDLRRGLDDFVAIALQHGSNPDSPSIRDGLKSWLLGALERHGCPQTEQQLEALVGLDLDLNAQGLEVWLSRQTRR